MADIDSNFPPSASVVGVKAATLLPPRWLPKGDCPKPVLPNAGAVDWAPVRQLVRRQKKNPVISKQDTKIKMYNLTEVP